MKILDSQGRLFGKISILDVGAAITIVLVAIGIFFFPGTSGSVAQVGANRAPVEIDVIVRGLSVRDPEALIANLRETGQTSIVIRNQPYGRVEVKSVERMVRNIAVPQPDGSVKALPDPRAEESFSTDMLITLAGEATLTEDGPVLGNNKIKIGTPVELEGQTYNFNASAIDVRTIE